MSTSVPALRPSAMAENANTNNSNEDVFEDQPTARRVDDLNNNNNDDHPSPNARTQPAEVAPVAENNNNDENNGSPPSSPLSPANLRAHRKSFRQEAANEKASSSAEPALFDVLDHEENENVPQQNKASGKSFDDASPSSEEEDQPEKVQERKFDSPNRVQPFTRFAEKVTDRDEEKATAMSSSPALGAGTRKKSVTNNNQDNLLASSFLLSPGSDKKVKILRRVPPHQSSWFQWKPTDAKQLEHAEKILLAPVSGRFLQNKIEGLNTLSFVPNTYIVNKLQTTLMYLKALYCADPEVLDESFDKNLLKKHVVLRHTILLHGMGAGACIWLPQLKHFGDLFDKKNLFAASMDGLLDLFGEEEAMKNNKKNDNDNEEKSNSTDPFALSTHLNASASVRNIDGTSYRKAFFGSSFANPAKVLEQLKQSGTTHPDFVSNGENKNKNKNSANNLLRRASSISPSAIKTLEEEEEEKKARKDLESKKVVINILHAIDLPGYARSDRDESVTDFDSPEEANDFMVGKLTAWSQAMQLDNAEKWILETKLKPKDTVVRVVREDDSTTTSTMTASPQRKQKQARSASPASASVRRKNNDKNTTNKQQVNNEELSIKSNGNDHKDSSPTAVLQSSPNKPNTNNPNRARSVVVLVDDAEEGQQQKLVRSPSPEATEPIKENTSSSQEQAENNKVVISPSPAAPDNNNNTSVSNGVVPKRIGANYSFRRKSSTVEQHLKQFEESTRDSRRRSVSQHVLNQQEHDDEDEEVARRNKNNDNEEDEEETDDDSNSDNEFYQEPENSTRYDPMPSNNKNRRQSSVPSTSLMLQDNNNNIQQHGDASSSKIFGSSRRAEVRSSRFIAPGEDSTFQKKKRNSSQSMDRSLQNNNNNGKHPLDANYDHDIALFTSENEKSDERESVQNFLETKLRKKSNSNTGSRHHITVIAHSYGAYLSGNWACQQPELIDHLILADCWGMIPRPTKAENREFYTKMSCFFKCIANCYDCTRSLPFSAIRNAGSWGPSILQNVRADYTARWKAILPDPIYFYDFIYHANAQEPATGEIAIDATSDKFGFCTLPLQDTLIKKLPVRIDLSLIYGDKTFMDRGAGFDLTEILRVQRQKVFEAGKKVVEEDIRKEQADLLRVRAEKERKRREIEDDYDREFGVQKKVEEEEGEFNEIRERHERRIPRVGKLTYETVFGAGHQVTTENAVGFNKLVQGVMEL